MLPKMVVAIVATASADIVVAVVIVAADDVAAPLDALPLPLLMPLLILLL